MALTAWPVRPSAGVGGGTGEESFIASDKLIIGALRYLAIPLAGAVAAWLVARRLDEQWWESRLGRRAPALVAGGALVVAAMFSGLLVARYETWHSFILDLGSYDQKAWLAATQENVGSMLEQTYRGGVKVAPCGVRRYWGVCHFQPLFIAYALAYRVWASPLVLLLSQALLVASGVIPCYLLARDRLGSAAGALTAGLYILHPAVQFNGLLDFRPDHVAIPFFFWAYWLVGRGRLLAAVVAAAVPALAKESLLVSFAFFGLYLAARTRRLAAGAAVFVAGMAVFVLVAFYLLAAPGRSEAEFMIGRYFSDPAALVRPELLARKIVYLTQLFGPLGFLSWLDPLALLPAIPSLGVSLVSNDANFVSIQSQYSASVVAPAFAGLITGVAWCGRRFGPRATPVRILGGLVVLSVFFSVASGPTPLSLNFWVERWGRQWHYSQYLPDRQDALDEAAALIPSDPDIMVVSQNDVNSARLAHRHFYFLFPNGLERADFVLLDTRRWPWVYWVPDTEYFGSIVRWLRASPDYRLVFDRDGVLLFGRVGPRRPGAPDLSVAPPVPGVLPR